MKYLMILTVGACLLFSSVPAMADQAEEEAAIREVMEQFFAEANKHDIKSALSLCVEDLENWTGSMKGRAAFEKYYTEFWGRNKDRQYELLDEIGIVFVTPDVAIYKYRDKATGGLDADGKPNPPQKRLNADVYVKKNGKWLTHSWYWRPIEE